MRMRYRAVPWVRYQADPEIKEFLMNQGTLKKYSKGETVIPPFYTYPYLSLIAGGMLAKGFNVQESSKMFSHSILLPGSTIGDFYFMTNSICNLTITALRDTTLIEVPHKIVKDHMAANALFMEKMLSHLMQDMASDSEGLATVTARPAEERLIILMKILMVRYNVAPADGWYKIPVVLTHEELSRIIYTTLLTVNRIFVMFRKNGRMIKNKEGRFLHRSLFDNIWDWYPEDPVIQMKL